MDVPRDVDCSPARRGSRARCSISGRPIAVERDDDVALLEPERRERPARLADLDASLRLEQEVAPIDALEPLGKVLERRERARRSGFRQGSQIR
jgi:hypothetical protein